MDIEISLLNKYFPWKTIQSDGICYNFKGDIFYKDNLLGIEELINVLSSLFVNIELNNKNLLELLQNFNGNFAIIIDTPTNSIGIVDRVRSIPLFYTNSDNQAIIADDCYYIKDRINKHNFSEANAVEFLLTGYVTGQETLIEGINQIQAGEVLIYDKNINKFNISCYHRYLYQDHFDLSEEKLLIKLDDIFLNVFKRLIELTANKGKQIAIPLSGGLDSRIIATFLKRLGVENVICFSYGRKDNLEAEISRQVAKALGYEWHFIEYTNKKLYENFHLPAIEEYDKYASNLVSLPVLQDFLAINELKDKGIITENTVIIPGHSACMLSGGSIPVKYVNSNDYNFELFINDNLNSHYNLWKWYNNEKLRHIFQEKIKNCIEPLDIHNNDSCANAIEIFNMKERQGKYIINSIRVYEFLGFEWKIPLWDSELIDFFSRIPINKKIGKQLYKKYAREKLFINDLEQLRKIKCTTEYMKENLSQSEIIRKKIIDFNYIDIFKGFLRYMLRVYYRFKDFYYYHIEFGEYFRYPLLSLFIIKIRNCNIEFFKDYPLLKFIIDTKNKGKNGVNIIGFKALYYLLRNFRYLQ